MKTGLFWSLHRAVRVVVWCLWLALAGFLFTQRAALEPGLDFAELWWNRPTDRPAELARLTGRVTQLFSADSFQLRDDQGRLFNYGLAGVQVPKPGPNATAAEQLRATASRTNATLWLAGQRVDIQVTLANPQTRTGLGVVWVGSTNVNAVMLREGHGALRRDQIRVLPLRTQFDLVRAERLARQKRVGIWAPAAGTE